MKEFKKKNIILFIASFSLAVSSSWAGPVPFSDIKQRKDTKKAISLFQPWEPISPGGIINLQNLSGVQQIGLHDLVHNWVDSFKLKWQPPAAEPFVGMATTFFSVSIQEGLKYRDSLLAVNPAIILIGEIRYYGAHKSHLPADHRFWLRDANGNQVPGFSKDFFRLNYDNPEFQTHVSTQCKALLETGVVDGIVLDALSDEKYTIVTKIREAIGPDGVIIGNVNRNLTPKITPLINGIYMESGWWGLTAGRQVFWDEIQKVISSNQQGLREPKLICTEVFSEPAFPDLLSKTEIHPDQLHILRAAVALLYTHSQGYFSFNPKSLGSHRHIYHEFLNASLGAPLNEPIQMTDGAYFKEWEKATVVYNPMLNKDITVTFNEPRKSQKTKVVGTTHVLPKYDGDIFLKGSYDQVYPDEKDFPAPVGVRKINNKTMGKKAVAVFTVICNEHSVLVRKQPSGSNPEFYTITGKKYPRIKTAGRK